MPESKYETRMRFLCWDHCFHPETCALRQESRVEQTQDKKKSTLDFLSSSSIIRVLSANFVSLHPVSDTLLTKEASDIFTRNGDVDASFFASLKDFQNKCRKKEVVGEKCLKANKTRKMSDKKRGQVKEEGKRIRRKRGRRVLEIYPRRDFSRKRK